jgi:hypothetical protein
LAIIYPSNLSKEENALRLGSVAGDLSGKSIEQIRDACKRYRTNGENKWFPTSGQLLDLLKNPYADAPNASHGFFKAPPEDYRNADKLRADLAYDAERKSVTSRLDEAEMHKRFLMTQELVRDHGWEWEAARRKVMVERTRALYPEYTIWPEIGTESA